MTRAAFTSIGVTSAVVACIVGSWLHRRGRPRLWTAVTPRPVRTLGLAIAAVAIAGLATISVTWRWRGTTSRQQP